MMTSPYNSTRQGVHADTVNESCITLHCTAITHSIYKLDHHFEFLLYLLTLAHVPRADALRLPLVLAHCMQRVQASLNFPHSLHW